MSNIEKCILQRLIIYLKIKFDNDNIKKANAAEEDSWDVRTRVKGIFGLTGFGGMGYGLCGFADTFLSTSVFLNPLMGLVALALMGASGASGLNIIEPGLISFSQRQKNRKKSLYQY